MTLLVPRLQLGLCGFLYGHAGCGLAFATLAVCLVVDVVVLGAD